MRTAAIWSGEAAKVVGAFIDPTALLALVFGLWRLGVDLGWTGDFVIAEGLFSHWQVWIALAIGIKSSEALLRPSKQTKTAKVLRRPVSAVARINRSSTI